MARLIYISAGHTLKGQDHGAVTKYGDEAKEARDFVSALSVCLKKYGITVYTEDDTWSLSNTIAWLARLVKSSDYTIDVHFNSFGTEIPTGTEVIVPDEYNQKEFELAKSLSSFISSTLGLINRGVKKESESQHSRLGILSNHSLASANNLLIEVCFISNPNDIKSYHTNFNKLVEGVADIINKTLK